MKLFFLSFQVYDFILLSLDEHYNFTIIHFTCITHSIQFKFAGNMVIQYFDDCQDCCHENVELVKRWGSCSREFTWTGSIYDYSLGCTHQAFWHAFVFKFTAVLLVHNIRTSYFVLANWGDIGTSPFELCHNLQKTIDKFTPQEFLKSFTSLLTNTPTKNTSTKNKLVLIVQLSNFECML